MRYIKETIVGLLAFGLYILNSVIWFIVIIPISILCIIPIQSWHRNIQSILEAIPTYWIDGNTLIQKLTIPRTRWVTRYQSNGSPITLHPRTWYLLISNHQSWVDILVLQRLFNRRIPLLKFSLKSELLWTLPLVSWICWLLGFPFIRRHTRQQLLQNPTLRMHNLKNTKRAYEWYKILPTTVANFVEGRRFTPILHQNQASPYRYLLRPQGGGIALSLEALSHRLDKILNVTILYSNPVVSFWDFLCGRISRITVYTEMVSITPDLIGDYIQDKSFRLHIQHWLNQLWAKKDVLIQKGEVDDAWLSYEI